MPVRIIWLKDAGIEKANIMTYSSILPGIAQEITQPENYVHGEVMETIMAAAHGTVGTRITTGIFMIGGGVPKNFTQDTVVCAEILGFDVPMHKYAVQITVADSRDRACSSSTLKEASS